jgi:hypothetical protein
MRFWPALLRAFNSILISDPEVSGLSAEEPAKGAQPHHIGTGKGLKEMVSVQN